MSDKLIERIDKTINGMTLAAVKFADKPASPEFAGMLALLQDCKQRIEELEADITISRADAETLVKRSKWDYPKPDSAIRQVVDEQANDEGLWCETKYASEAYLQAALRRLHEAIEGKSAEECARAVLDKPASVVISRGCAIEAINAFEVLGHPAGISTCEDHINELKSALKE